MGLISREKVTEMKKTRLNFLVDMALFVAFVLSAMSGAVFLFLPHGGFQGGRNPEFQAGVLFLSRVTWDTIRTWASLIFVAGMAVHLALHWRWVVCVARRYA